MFNTSGIPPGWMFSDMILCFLDKGWYGSVVESINTKLVI